MIKKSEITSILIVVLIIAFLISLQKGLTTFLYAFLSVFIIFIVNIIAKKITSSYFESEIEISFWETKRYGFKPGRRFLKPFPSGLLFPFLSKILFFPFNTFVWMASLVFEVKPKISRAAKVHGLYSYSEMTEFHTGLIAASGIFANLLLAFIGYLIGLPSEMFFVQLNIFYAFFNIIPASNLDGNKIFFGSNVLWTFLASVIIIAMISLLIII